MKGAIPLVNSEKRKQLIDTCILAGKIMLESGSEVYRTEDTITRIAANAGEPESVCYTTATGIFVGFRSSNYTQLENIPSARLIWKKLALSISYQENLRKRDYFTRALSALNSIRNRYPLFQFRYAC